MSVGVAMLASSAGGAVSERLAQETGQTPYAYSFRFSTPIPVIGAGAEGRARVDIPGFETRERREGAPSVPTKTYWIAIPADAEPVLEIANYGEVALPGVRPQRVAGTRPARPRIESTSRSRLEPAGSEEEAYSTGNRPHPAEVAWLGSVGVLRDQRYVEVHLAPVRYDPAVGGLRVATALDVTVRFEGTRGARHALRVDPAFEDVYRAAFLNYAQGLTFRLGDSAPREGRVDTDALESAASSPRQRIRVRANGVLRLDHARVATTPFVSVALATWKLTNRGVEVPLQIQDTNGNGFLDPGEWVQFYGQALDDEPKTVLNTDIPGTDVDIFEARDFSDENVYFLTSEAGARSRIATRASASNAAAAPADFDAVARLEVDNAYVPLGAADPWYWGPSLVSNATSARIDTVPLPGLASPTAPLRVLVKLRGTSEDFNVFPDHRTRVSLLDSTNVQLAFNDDDGTFDGRTLYTHDFTWSYPGAGATATNPVKVRTEARPVLGSHRVILDWIEVRYRRSFQASGDTLTFAWPNGDARFDVTGLTDTTAQVYEITGRVGTSGVVDPVRITGATYSGSAGNHTMSFRVDLDAGLAPGSTRRFVVSGSAAASIPADADFQSDTVSDLRNPSNQADLIVIAHPAVLDLSAGSPLSQLLARRATQGISSKVVLIEDVQDEFNDGLAGPVAIRNFLAWVMSTAPGQGWASPKPGHVLFLGDASYDYKAGPANGNFVPTQILFRDVLELGYLASDSLLAAVVGNDLVPDLAVGRLTARTVTEANALLQKILNYETIAPGGAWRGNTLTISDRGKDYSVNEALDFERMNDVAMGYMQRPPYTVRNLRYWSDFCAATVPCSVAATSQIRQAIKDAVNGTDGFSDGTAIVQYSGHGNFEVWSDDAFFDERNPPPRDTASLVNGTRLPWLLAHNCLTGGFQSTLDHSMGEDWMKSTTGGSIAVFSPTGLSFNSVGENVINSVFRDLFGPTKERRFSIATLNAHAALCQIGAFEACQSYAFQGDPSQRIALPDIAPPTGVQAVAGNARVDLSWTASATPGAAYSVYRAQTIQNPFYAKLNATPITGTSFADLTALNQTTYYYYVVAVGSGGYESRWSNFNSDCTVNGPDCLRATPTNPNPPLPPTGLVAVDAETGGRLNLSWSANLESDIKNYDIHYGVDPTDPSAPCPITQVATVGRVTSFSLTGLVDGVRYCLALTATNTSLRTSSLSAEATGVPNQVLGEKSPGFIADLKLGKSGSSAVLTWGAVATDIYGKPETVARYEVYRGTAPDFVPGPGSLIGMPTVPTFTDTNALAGGLPNYHYLVRAVDAQNNAGGLGRQLPAGIRGLVVGKAGAQVTLSWPAVTTDFDGKPTRIDRYEVYASSQPFRRAHIRDGLVPLLLNVYGVTVDVTPLAGAQYWSVLAVDTKGNKSPF